MRGGGQNINSAKKFNLFEFLPSVGYKATIMGLTVVKWKTWNVVSLAVL